MIDTSASCSFILALYSPQDRPYSFMLLRSITVWIELEVTSRIKFQPLWFVPPGCSVWIENLEMLCLCDEMVN